MAGKKGKSGRPIGAMDKYPRSIKGQVVVDDNGVMKKHIERVTKRTKKLAQITTDGYLIVDKHGKLILRKGRPEYWTLESTISELMYILNIILNDPTIYTKHEIFENLPFTTNNLRYAINKFSEDETIKGLIDKIDEVLEGRLVKGGLKSEIQGSFARFILEARYEGYQTKQVVEHTSNTNILIAGESLKQLEFLNRQLGLLQEKNDEVLEVDEC